MRGAKFSSCDRARPRPSWLRFRSRSFMAWARRRQPRCKRLALRQARICGAKPLSSCGRGSAKQANWYFEIARGRDDRPVQSDRERKSFGSETTFSEDLVDPARIEAGVIAMADDVWGWCEKTNCLGRTVTVKIKWADFQISSRSRSTEAPIETRAKLHELALELIRSVFPPPKAIRLVGVTLSNFRSPTAGSEAELPFREI